MDEKVENMPIGLKNEIWATRMCDIYRSIKAISLFRSISNSPLVIYFSFSSVSHDATKFTFLSSGLQIYLN
jgi:hypothetical protein